MPSYEFNTTVGNYRNKATGRNVSASTVAAWVFQAQDALSTQLETHTRQYQAGTINDAEWAIRSGESIKAAHRAVVMIAYGGKAQMDNSAWGFAGGVLRRELQYFNHFAAELSNLPDGEPIPDAAISRAKSYAASVWSTYSQALARRVRANSHAEFERNQLEKGSEHCVGCLTATVAGTVPLGTLTPIGHRECGTRCKCRLVYS